MPPFKISRRDCLKLAGAVGAAATSAGSARRIAATKESAILNIGSRRELFVDTFLIERLENAALRLHHPIPREVSLKHDAPWEGSGCGYHTVFRDGDRFRMYYTANHLPVESDESIAKHPIFAAYAESTDGIHWDKPDLGLFEFGGSTRNNIVWAGRSAHDFTPFLDTNPECRPDEKYKAVAVGDGGLVAFKSTDGIHWIRLVEGPMITRGAFDTQNLAFWDTVQGQYRAYIRDFHNGIRDIRTSVSDDFRTWSQPEILQFPGSPDEQLYTNQVLPYLRAPHILLGFPTRYVERDWSQSMRDLPDRAHRELRSAQSQRFGTAITDGLFMSSRDGRTFHRWGEAFIRPGIERPDNWVYGDGYQNWGIIETESDVPGAPTELSVYSLENSWKVSCQLRRFTLRTDGFVSVNAPLSGGEFVTRPLRFDGDRLEMNFSTSAAGSVRVEIQEPDGTPVEGYALDDCPDIFGDSLARTVRWTSGSDLGRFSGKPVRLRFVLNDADLYAIQFHHQSNQATS